MVLCPTRMSSPLNKQPIWRGLEQNGVRSTQSDDQTRPRPERSESRRQGVQTRRARSNWADEQVGSLDGRVHEGDLRRDSRRGDQRRNPSVADPGVLEHPQLDVSHQTKAPSRDVSWQQRHQRQPSQHKYYFLIFWSRQISLNICICLGADEVLSVGTPSPVPQPPANESEATISDEQTEPLCLVMEKSPIRQATLSSPILLQTLSSPVSSSSALSASQAAPLNSNQIASVANFAAYPATIDTLLQYSKQLQPNSFAPIYPSPEMFQQYAAYHAEYVRSLMALNLYPRFWFDSELALFAYDSKRHDFKLYCTSWHIPIYYFYFIHVFNILKAFFINL